MKLMELHKARFQKPFRKATLPQDDRPSHNTISPGKISSNKDLSFDLICIKREKPSLYEDLILVQ